MPRLLSALPFWISLVLLPLAAIGAVHGGWTVVLLPLYGWIGITLLDAFVGHNTANPDTQTPDRDLFWYRLITLMWFPMEAAAIYGCIWWVTHHDTLAIWERIVLFFGLGVISGSIGITYAHELLHQKNRLERWLGDLLLALVLYSHFRTEHLLVHHRYVGTPRDAVTARYNEGFHRFFPRVLREGPASAWRAERQMLARANRATWHRSNPFWRYGLLQAVALLAAWLVGGWAGLGLFLWQAFVAIWQLELVNYVEHYGLTREHLGEGRYEPVGPHHSWNADHAASNWMLINLQRHSDHHCRPDRRFPLLQTYGAEKAPQLPLGFPAMTALAMIPPLWRRRMNPRVRAWRRAFYPGINDWSDYNRGRLPMPRGAS
ncbi:alkane 1-monooxygenase [Defluviimonas sp. WL0002]|uniref:Alkane 1-monooxygenase n=1 Tax=Albidovulum marisflavi TaxID=2984159 RepID=A0ABT2Z8W1_9RHOB|nr:alkane 1-monooxygenase [Defluviimonas sp. WL0002]MCV2867546.1 alkane 1-monooxygenase [Defluviimonas sp. WL0002]